jgi:hypothetical protein
MAAAAQLSVNDRALFGSIADYLIPAYGKMPSATKAGVTGPLLDEILRLRPDLVDAFFRGVSKLNAPPTAEAVESLHRSDLAAFDAISLVASGAYYMIPEVRTVVGYPGQESLTYDAYQTPDYLCDGLLERVVMRGPVYRPTPR